MDARRIKRALHRMVTEIIERNRELNSLAIVGIRTRGIYLGKRVANMIKELEDIEIPVGVLDITLYRDDFSELEAQHMVKKTEIDFSVGDKEILLVDDVLFTGRTIRAAMDSLFDLGRPKASNCWSSSIEATVNYRSGLTMWANFSPPPNARSCR